MSPKVKKYEIYIGRIIILSFQTILTFHEIWNRFWCELASILAWFLRSWTILGRLGAVLGPSWERLGPPCRLHKRLEFLNDFGVDFLIILVSFWEPSSAQLGPRWRPKSGKNLTGGLPGGVPEPTMYPNSFLEASATIFWRCLMVFLSIFGQFLVDFWSIFGWVWSFVSRFSHWFFKVFQRSFQSIFKFF